MTRREQRAIAAFTRQSGLPPGTFVVLPFRYNSSPQLRIWIDHAFLHAVHELPKEINGIDVSIEPMPKAHTYEH
jgi:hypothetical protein